MFSTEQLRNLAFVGQSGVGKTTLCEALLHASGAIEQRGHTERGSTVSDHDPIEQRRGHSLQPTLLRLEHGSARINLIDTPGLEDFNAEAIAVLPAVETMAVVLDARNGLDSIAERMLAIAVERRLCRMLIINHIDHPQCDLEGLLTTLQTMLGSQYLPLNLPAENATTVSDCFFAPSGPSDFGHIEDAHTQIIDQVVELDENLMERYLEQGQQLDPAQLHAPFEQALREGHLVPVCFCSATTGAGVAALLDIIDRLLPHPGEGNPRPFFRREDDGTHTPFRAVPDSEAHVLAHVFRISHDPYLGRTAWFRLHQGTLRRQQALFIGDGRKPFKMAHLYRHHGSTAIEVDDACAGDLCALSRIDDIRRDDVLHDSHDEDHIHLEALPFAMPLHGLAIRPADPSQEQKLGDALTRLTEADPGLVLEFHQRSGERVLRGGGELHLEVALERLREQFNVEVVTQPPQVDYRETVRSSARGRYRHRKQSGGAGQFGEVTLRVEPLPRGTGFHFASEVVGGAIPSAFIPAVEKGVLEAMQEGIVEGYPVQDIRVVVEDGKHHAVDSKEVAFVIAGREALRKALRAAKAIILEPIAHMTLRVPESATGAITGDLAGRRGRISGTEMQGELMSIHAEAPLAELEGYSSRLRSLTGGSGQCRLEYSHHDPLPPGTPTRKRETA